jgi:hypothetical protein
VRDNPKFALASAHLDTLRKNLETITPEDRVREYGSVVDDLEDASGEDLSPFRTKYYDTNLFACQIDALCYYLSRVLDAASADRNSTDYWSMTDAELEARARKYNIGSFGDQPGNINREIIISELLKRDRALQAENRPVSTGTFQVGSKTGYIIQKGTTDSQATMNSEAADVKSIVEELKTSMNDISLSEEARNLLIIEIRTIEQQLKSLRPSAPVVAECLRSIRAILKGTAGSVIATAVIHAITDLVGA